MSIYTINKHDDGSIILEPIQSNADKYISGYELLNNDNGDITLKKITKVKIIDVGDISSYDFTSSTIVSCSIGDCDIGHPPYTVVIDHVYKTIGDGVKIIKHASINMSTLERSDKGFRYNKDIGISVQGQPANKCVYEIANQCVKNAISINMNIKLNNGVFVELVF
jgi:predicted RNA methylase